MSRFFINKESIDSGFISITGEDYNHIRNVLRYKLGDELIVSDLTGVDFRVVLSDFGQGKITARILESFRNSTESEVQITLYQALPKSDKMDLIIQKCVELGVHRIVPVLTERIVVKLGQGDADSKITRWRRISFEAAKQCNRGLIPDISVPVVFDEALKTGTADDLCIIPYEKDKKNKLKNYIQNSKDIKKISVLIGPEGGFSEEEVEKAIKSGFIPISLGPRILRTETAAIAVVSILMYELGDI